uniref:hypothetical protein n=1 Tax=Acinetobacter baumannii TaxID=470 RepID=UPI001C06875C
PKFSPTANNGGSFHEQHGLYPSRENFVATILNIYDITYIQDKVSKHAHGNHSNFKAIPKQKW